MPVGIHHAGGVNVVFGEGAVKFFKDAINLAAWRVLGTLAAGEALSPDSHSDQGICARTHLQARR